MLLRIHSSDRTTFKRCRTLWDFTARTRRNLEPLATQEPFWFGIGIHEALASYYDPAFPERDPERAIGVWNDYVDLWLKSRSDVSIDDEQWAAEQRTTGEGMLRYYCYWAAKHDNFDVVWVEREFEVDIPGLPGVSYSFRCDGLVRDKHGRLYILEHKTSSKLHDSTEWLQMDDQVSAYIWCLQRLLGVKIEGVIYNVLLKQAPQGLKINRDGFFSTDKRQRTTYEIAKLCIETAHDGKIPARYREYLEWLEVQPDKFVQRIEVRRNQREIELLGESLRYEVLDMVNNPAIYRTPSAFNCNRCPFIAPCLVRYEGGDYEDILALNYQERSGV